MSEVNKRLNKKLHKFSKRYTKTKSLKSLSASENGIFLVFKTDNAFSPISPVYSEMTMGTIIVQRQHYGVFFFELFKYLRKYQDFMNFAHNKGGDKALLEDIKNHLLIHFKKKMKEEPVAKVISNQLKRQVPKNNMMLISHYSNFIDTCFKLLERNSEVTLVIQKKIGYKYYENVVYT